MNLFSGALPKAGRSQPIETAAFSKVVDVRKGRLFSQNRSGPQTLIDVLLSVIEHPLTSSSTINDQHVLTVEPISSMRLRNPLSGGPSGSSGYMAGLEPGALRLKRLGKVQEWSEQGQDKRDPGVPHPPSPHPVGFPPPSLRYRKFTANFFDI
jgi:hypothetical protein